jgi:hypothetical protein
VLEGLAELSLVPDPREPLAQLRGERVVDVEPPVPRRLAEDLLVQRVEAVKLRDGPLVVVDAEVDEDVGQARVAAVLLDDEERRGLLAAAVASRLLGGGE